MAIRTETRRGPDSSMHPHNKGTEAGLSELRDSLTTLPYLVPRLVALVVRHPSEKLTVLQLVRAGAFSMGLRLLVPVTVTTLAGAWADAPLWRWAIIAVLLAAGDVYFLRRQGANAPIDDLTAVIGALEREADVRRVVSYTRRWFRMRVNAPVAVVMVLLILAVATIADPHGPASIHVGSAAMPVALLYEFCEIFFALFFTALCLRLESRYPHRLSWQSPADTPVIRRALGGWGDMAVVSGVTVTIFMVLVMVLAAPGTTTFLIVLVAAMTLSGYLATIVSDIGVRSSVRTIVRRHKEDTLERLQRRIDDFGPRIGDLTPTESERLQGLLRTFAAVRDAPASPGRSETIGHAVTALAVPGMGFFLAVLAEVYAERLLSQVLH
ncbi:MAG TPA: hypothetical protein VFJ22_09245 [Dermatophilaceae bacterium]|nr:hypothetical protein [Dermatophilaceae bacterium]